MAHATLRPGHGAYARFAARLNRFPQGAPPSERLFQILRLLVSEEEAGLLAQVPIRPFTARRAAAIWKLPEARARAILETLAGRAMLLDWEQDGETRYVVPPPMAGFFEFSMMRVRGDADQAALAELFHQYLNVEEDFLRALFANGETQLGRVFVDETALPREDALVVLDHERASEVVRTAGAIGIGACYCRHKMARLGRACDAPMEICMTFGTCADSLTRHQVARRVEAAECLDLLDQARERGLVQFGENVREQVSFICNCCGCCCEAMVAARRFAFMKPVHTTNFLPELEEARCTGCGKCVGACPVEALALVSAHDPRRPAARRARLDEDRCLGCGVCVRTCAPAAIRLRPRKARVLTPANTAHRTVVMALERGQLAELLVDGQSTHGHRAVAAILGAVLKLPPLQRALASRQVKSRYLDRLMAGR
ncbi:4Fe-4S dicluster domain-containing protein [Geothrix sp. SG200]|uniref:4Fe-4S dicluster domain-containing protein n=1 Tax=Geothrix sp. SG200 TaxID=2922865 RepID=UPI001FADA3DD|nr:4Fe-4S dicluster domain-containing protein [Geothrix sp. SG200]